MLSIIKKSSVLLILGIIISVQCYNNDSNDPADGTNYFKSYFKTSRFLLERTS